MVIGGFQRADRGVGQVAHFFVRHLVVVAIIEHKSLFIRQLSDSNLQPELNFVAVEILVGSQTGCHEAAGVVERIGAEPLPLRQKRERFVGRNSVKPSVQFRLSLEIGNAAPGFDERVLQHVVGIGMGANETADMPIKPLLKCLHEQPEALFGAVRLGHEGQDFFVGNDFCHALFVCQVSEIKTVRVCGGLKTGVIFLKKGPFCLLTNASPGQISTHFAQPCIFGMAFYFCSPFHRTVINSQKKEHFIMLIIEVKDGETIDKALKKYKKKFERAGTLKELRRRKAFVKPSVTRRFEVLKAAYKEDMYGHKAEL